MESLEGVPAVADGDAARAIVGVLIRVWIEAAGSHCLPRTVSTSLAQAVFRIGNVALCGEL
jgi:hypothetical protein